MHSGRQISRFKAVALPLKECQDRLRRRAGAGDLLTPSNLLRSRSFLFVGVLRRTQGPGKRCRHDASGFSVIVVAEADLRRTLSVPYLSLSSRSFLNAKPRRQDARQDKMKEDDDAWGGGLSEEKEVTTSEAKEEKPTKRRRPRRALDAEVEAEGPKAEEKAESNRAVEGWGASNAPAEEETKNTEEEEEEEEVPKGRNRRRAAEDDEEETEILIIPDLDEQAEEDIAFQVAEAPKNRSRKLPTMEELDAELAFVTPSSFTKDGRRLNLTPLACRLVPAPLVHEDNEPWTFDSLLQSVTQEFAVRSSFSFHNLFCRPTPSSTPSSRRRLRTPEKRMSSPKPNPPCPNAVGKLRAEAPPSMKTITITSTTSSPTALAVAGPVPRRRSPRNRLLLPVMMTTPNNNHHRRVFIIYLDDSSLFFSPSEKRASLDNPPPQPSYFLFLRQGSWACWRSKKKIARNL